jgi:RimJ/RimL family protein N-acetyltransferase
MDQPDGHAIGLRDRIAGVVDRDPWDLHTTRLDLWPIRREHAPEMFRVLASPELYTYTGGKPPPSVDYVARWFQSWESRRSPDGSELWLNWVVRERVHGDAVGYVQASVEETVSAVAWVIGTPWQQRGYASEAAAAIVEWLNRLGESRFRACVKPTHIASQRVAQHLGMHVTDQWIDGEEVWSLERLPGAAHDRGATRRTGG